MTMVFEDVRFVETAVPGRGHEHKYLVAWTTWQLGIQNKLATLI